MSIATISTAALLLAFSHFGSALVDERSWPVVEFAADGTYSVRARTGSGRSTPAIDAPVLGQSTQDIDGDGIPELVVIDGRESAFGSVTAVYVDVSVGEPYLAFQCQASTAEAVETECLEWYESLTAERAIQGTDIIYSGTRREGELDWETQHLAIPNWTTSIALTISILNVELHRERHANSRSEDSLAGLEAALDLRELRALQFSIAD